MPASVKYFITFFAKLICKTVNFPCSSACRKRYSNLLFIYFITNDTATDLQREEF